VLIQARVLVTGGPKGATDSIEADFRDPETVLVAAARTLDFTRPVAVMLLGILGHFSDDEVASLIGQVCVGCSPCRVVAYEPALRGMIAARLTLGGGPV
jgi:O-methyltransferase involved in polyketide biosynthesis